MNTPEKPYYVNQLDYEHIPYLTDVDHPKDKRYAKKGNICIAGCGICSASMLIYHLTGKAMKLEDLRDLSYRAEANREIGTDMKRYAPLLAELYGLELRMSDSTMELLECLSYGGAAIINVGGNHDGYHGIFSDVGHYIFAKSYRKESNEIGIMDSAYRPGKYDDAEISGKVRMGKNYEIYTTVEILKQETSNRSPAFYLFRMLDKNTVKG